MTQRELKSIVLHLSTGELLNVLASCYSNWAVHRTIGAQPVVYSVTYVPRGLAAEESTSLERALRLAEELERVVPEYTTPAHAELIKAVVESHQTARRVR